MSRKAIADPLVEEGIQWMVRLQSGEISHEELQALEHWRGASPQHEAVFLKLSQRLSPLRDSPWRSHSGDQLLRAMQAPSGRRQFLRVSLALGGLALVAGTFLRLERAGLALPGDLYTGTAERRFWILEDGSRLDLNARSVVATRFDAQQRALRMRQGELLLRIEADRRGPFELETDIGQVRARQGRLLLREEAQGMRVVTLDTPAQLTLRSAGTHEIDVRRSVLFDEHGLLANEAMQPSESAWVDGWLAAHDRSLAWVVEAIRPYRRGVLRLDTAVSGLRVSGLYPLDNSDLTLEMLERSLPIRVVRRSDYWVSVEAQG
ncbi:FecR family protein [Pseudomonas aeruginosa]|uniref:FecR family protein n=1 Tax=Pseudomonas aeruginosa TaxID=287 RepID=UPI0005141CF3|nr:FecR domain-containing protein [Pseudomonas aeruginosa]MBX6190287.1 FecR domain-containing protein [Pseudomonas aeruginosa]MBX6716961.1 FecR domain-containing protein [Pseudomonas aeruginosa]MBX6872440.1 FecR domain-containing protein [Pseudomonas aeruginosa]QKL12985.1 FecR domain-containing protein [Pseudomonas aeruginosa]QQV96160.1 FecR domain-containing protein [Pseudomonas aeruginosa]